MPAPRNSTITKEAIVSVRDKTISANDVEKIFREVAKEGPYPDADDYAQMAAWLDGSKLSYSSDILLAQRSEKAVEAARVLAKYLEEFNQLYPLRDSFREAAKMIPLLEAHIHEKARILKGQLRNDRAWTVPAFVAVEACNRALVGLGRPTGTGIETITVQFTSRALGLMGFPAISTRMVHNALKAAKRRP